MKLPLSSYSILICTLILTAMSAGSAFAQSQPNAPGKLVDLGGHHLHVNCTGKGSPTVVVENGFGDFSFDWMLVQSQVSPFTRVCTYDRAGYAWSDPGPMPRTLAQINLELKDALKKLGEHGPFVLVGHSFGGPIVRNFALTYPKDVAGIVFVDAVNEDQRYTFRGKAILIRSGAPGKTIPPPHEDMRASDKLSNAVASDPQQPQALDPMYNVLPPAEQKLQLWAQALPEMENAENSQREWSPESLAKWHAESQAGTLGAIPVLVLTRAKGGYGDDLDIPAAQLEKERKDAQANLAKLSSNGKQIIVDSGHNMELEVPDQVAAAIHEIVIAVREHKKL
jgi:pimeloyl-ACP methyl ester carboxylesterase